MVVENFVIREKAFVRHGLRLLTGTSVGRESADWGVGSGPSAKQSRQKSAKSKTFVAPATASNGVYAASRSVEWQEVAGMEG